MAPYSGVGARARPARSAVLLCAGGRIVQRSCVALPRKVDKGRVRGDGAKAPDFVLPDQGPTLAAGQKSHIASSTVHP